MAKKTGKPKTTPPPMPIEIGTTPNVRSGNFSRRVYPDIKGFVQVASMRADYGPKTRTQPPAIPSTPKIISTKSQPVNAKEAARLAKEITKFNKTYPQNPRPVNSGLGPRDMRPSYSPSRGDALSGRTPEGGTRSLLEGFRSFIRGGGLSRYSK